MHIATRLISYFGVLGALIGGGAGALLLLAPEPGAATTAPATIQPKPLPPKIAAWQERIAIPLPPNNESRTAEPTRPIPAAVAPAPRPVINQPGATAIVAQPKQKPKTNRAPPPSESALGYAETPAPVRHEQAVFAFRERPSQ